MNLESKIPGINNVASIEDAQQRCNAIQELFNTSDHGAHLVDFLLDEIAELCDTSKDATSPADAVLQTNPDSPTATVQGASAALQSIPTDITGQYLNTASGVIGTIIQNPDQGVAQATPEAGSENAKRKWPWTK